MTYCWRTRETHWQPARGKDTRTTAARIDIAPTLHRERGGHDYVISHTGQTGALGSEPGQGALPAFNSMEGTTLQQ